MAFSVTLAGQDITNYTDQMSLDIIDALGQSSGAGSSPLPQGRAGTIQFDTSLGPSSTATGAGQALPANEFGVTLDGISGYLSFPSAVNGNGLTALSVELWVNISSTALFGKFTNLISSGTAANKTGYQIYWSGTSTLNANLGNGTSNGFITSTLSPPVGHWLYIVVTYDGSAIRMYQNGVLVSGPVSFSGAISATGTPVLGGSFVFNSFTPGSFDEVAIYPSALPASTIATRWGLRNADPSPYRASVLSSSPLAYYELEESGGSIAVDSSGNGNGATYNTSGVIYRTRGAFNTPSLVRQGEIIVTNAAGQVIWGGYATKLTDITAAQAGKTVNLGVTTQNFTTINGVDYEGQLARVMVNVSYVGQTDVQIIQQVLQQYAPWISTDLLPATGTFIFPAQNFRQVSVLQVIQTVAGVTGYLVWVDFAKHIHYTAPNSAATAPFSVSDKPDFLTSFPHNVYSHVVDDNSAINRVTFYGGKENSGDFTQDVSPLANGNNTIFTLAYYPTPTSDGKFHALINGVEQVVGFATGEDTPANTFKSKGGLADALMDTGAHNITFDVAPPAGSTVLVKYQYQFPLTVVVTDETSHKFFGDPYLDGYISDSSVFSTAIAVQRCRVVLTQQSFGLTSLEIYCWQPGLQSGQLLQVTNSIRGINGIYLIQEVETVPLGAGNFVFQVTCGAWNWNLVDVIKKLTAGAAVSDQSQAENVSTLVVQTSSAKVSVSSAWIKKTETTGPYYARSTPVGDGHDAYPGFATISS